MATIDIVTQAEMFVANVANMAIGKYFAKLQLAKTTMNWPDPLPASGEMNSNEYLIPELGVFQANELPVGGEVTYQDPNATATSITCVTYESSFIWDFTMDSSKQANKLDAFIEECVKTIAAKAEQYFFETIAATAGLERVGTAGAAPTEDNLKDAVVLMGDAEVPFEDRWLVATPRTYTDIIDIDNYKNYDKTGVPGIALKGRLGMVEGLNFWESPYVHVAAVGPPKETENLIYQRDSIVNIFPPQKDRNAFGQIKSSAEMDGIRIAVLLEGVPSRNAATGVTVSSTMGVVVIDKRKDGVIILDAR